MKQLRSILEGVGSTLLLLLRSASYAGTLPRQFSRFIGQCYDIGYTTLPIVAILCFSVGSVLALQSGYSMEDFQAQPFIGALVGLSMVRELGPMMTAILLAGRVGSAMTAELASMKVYQEIDALITMNIPPARMLVLPRLAAVLMMMPVLLIIANLVGWYGGALICKYTGFIAIEPDAYFRHPPPLREVQGRGRRPLQGGGLRLRGRAGLLQHRPQHPRRPARDRRGGHPRGGRLADPHPRPRLLRHEDPPDSDHRRPFGLPSKSHPQPLHR